MKSKSLQLQSNKSEEGAATTRKRLLFMYYIYSLETCGVAPLVAPWRETKLKCWTWTETGFSFLSLKVNITVTPNVSPCSVRRARQLSLTGGEEGGRASVHRVPLCCGPPGVNPTAQHFLLGLHSTLPSSPRKKEKKKSSSSSSKTGQSRLSLSLRHTRHLQQDVEVRRARLSSPSPPSLSSLTQRSL